VSLLVDESDRPEVTDLVARRFGPMGKDVAIGTADQLAAHFRSLRSRGVDRFYVWFTDFAPPDTLRRFADVLARM
jgi:hypothetical protein